MFRADAAVGSLAINLRPHDMLKRRALSRQYFCRGSREEGGSVEPSC